MASDPSVLFAIRQEWVSSRSYAERVANISGSGIGPRDNGDNFLMPGGNVFNDRKAGSVELLIDEVLGNEELDWFLIDDVNDSNDADAGEVVVDLSAFPLT
jgi:hypothetical protein